jgi:hypothetical protein
MRFTPISRSSTVSPERGSGCTAPHTVVLSGFAFVERSRFGGPGARLRQAFPGLLCLHLGTPDLLLCRFDLRPSASQIPFGIPQPGIGLLRGFTGKLDSLLGVEEAIRRRTPFLDRSLAKRDGVHEHEAQSHRRPGPLRGQTSLHFRSGGLYHLGPLHDLVVDERAELLRRERRGFRALLCQLLSYVWKRDCLVYL